MCLVHKGRTIKSECDVLLLSEYITISLMIKIRQALIEMTEACFKYVIGLIYLCGIYINYQRIWESEI